MSDGDADGGVDPAADTGASDDANAEVILTLPEWMRGELKDPLGVVYTDAEALLADAGEPLVAVGDIVTYHLLRADYRPAVALVDGRTEREQVEGEITAAVEGFGDTVEVVNPAATLTADLLEALSTALDRPGPTVLVVDGEEDLAALPAVLAAPEGSAVVYGQPGEGMVLATVNATLKGEVRTLLARMDGDHERLWAALDVEGTS